MKMGMSEEQVKETLKDRKRNDRLNRAIIEGKRHVETVEVKDREGDPFDVVIHALSEISIGRCAENVGLPLNEILKEFEDARKARVALGTAKKDYAADSEEVKRAQIVLNEAYARDPRSLQKARFFDEIFSAALVGDVNQQLTAEELSDFLPTIERVKVFNKVMQISQITSKGNMEKFRGQPAGGEPERASV